MTFKYFYKIGGISLYCLIFLIFLHTLLQILDLGNQVYTFHTSTQKEYSNGLGGEAIILRFKDCNIKLEKWRENSALLCEILRDIMKTT